MKAISKEQQIVTTRMVYEYEAFDGKRFSDWRECEEYEEKARDVILSDSSIRTCKELDDYPNFDGGEYWECHEYKWYFPESPTDIEKLMCAFGNEGLDLDDRYCGEWICIERTDEGDAWCTTLEDGVRYAKNVLEKLGYKMTVTDKEGNEL